GSLRSFRDNTKPKPAASSIHNVVGATGSRMNRCQPNNRARIVLNCHFYKPKRPLAQPQRKHA
ncbi:MAG: hypothetical protein ACI81Q_000449, partial [Paracoccaceae bacterium]